MHELRDRYPGPEDSTIEAAGEPDGGLISFEELYSGTRASMVRLASFLVASRAEGEELTQDAFADLFRQWDTAVNPPALLRTLVVRRCKRALQRRINERRKLELVSRRDGRGRADAREPDFDVASAIGGLNPDRRAVVVMRFYLDMSHAQIADAVDCSVGTARTRLHRAVADLKVSMSEFDSWGQETEK